MCKSNYAHPSIGDKFGQNKNDFINLNIRVRVFCLIFLKQKLDKGTSNHVFYHIFFKSALESQANQPFLINYPLIVSGSILLSIINYEHFFNQN